MSRGLSSSTLKAMYAEETGDYPIILLTITEASLLVPIRVSSDPTVRIVEEGNEIIYGTVSRGDTFVHMPFQIKLPTDQQDASPSASLTIDNVSRLLVPTIRSLTSPPSVTIEMVMASALDVVEMTFPDFELSSIQYDATTISGELTVNMMTAEPFPSGNFNPSQFPGAF